MKGVRRRLEALKRSLERGGIDSKEWAEQFDKILLDGHAEAVKLGILRAGGELPDADEILIRARGFKDLEAEFLQGFEQAVANKDPRYFDEAGDFRPGSLDARAGLYVGKMRGSANEEFVAASDDDARWTWELGAEKHCDDCPEYAQIIVDVPADEVIAYPGGGDSECLGNCACVLIRSDGVRGFDRSHLGGDGAEANRRDLSRSASQILTDYSSLGQESYEAARDSGISWVVDEDADSPWQEVSEATERKLEAAQIDEIVAFRGLQVPRTSELGKALANAQPGDRLEMQLTFASYSDRVNVATSYANKKLRDTDLGLTVRRIIKREDVVATHHTDRGLKNEREMIGKGKDPVEVEIVQISDQVKAKKRAKSEFAKGRFLGTFTDTDPLVKDRMVPSGYYKK